MAINHVYLIDRDPQASAVQVPSAFFEQFDTNGSYPSLTIQKKELINTVNEHTSLGCKDNAMGVVLEHMGKDSKNHVTRIMNNVLSNYDYTESIYQKDESLFIDSFLNVIFPPGGTLSRDGPPDLLDGADVWSIGTTTHFINGTTKKVDSLLVKHEKKHPTKIGSQTYDFLVFGIKCPSSVVKEDIFKLSLELQLMLNRLITNKFDKLVVYGVIGQGFDFDVYRMELVAPLLYLMVKVRSFYLPRSLYDLSTALSAIPALLQLKELTCSEVDKARKSGPSSDSKKSEWSRKPLTK